MFKDLISEITGFIKGSTIDALIPPTLFVVLNAMIGLSLAIALSLSISLVLLFIRWMREENIKYGLLGFVMVGFASLLAYLTNNPTTYFLPDLITNIALVILSIILLIRQRPLAIYASHLTRTWPIDWYLRLDVKPAYSEVSVFWCVFFLIKTIIQIGILFNPSLNILNLIIGLPFTLIVMSLSYMYGIIRLKQLHGPSVDEFIQNKPMPYKGQSKGF